MSFFQHKKPLNSGDLIIYNCRLPILIINNQMIMFENFNLKNVQDLSTSKQNVDKWYASRFEEDSSLELRFYD